MEITTSPTRSGEVRSYVQLLQQIHQALCKEHPKWVEPNGDCPTCEFYESLAELLALSSPHEHRSAAARSDEGSIKLFEYGDYECPFCGQVQPIVKEIQLRLGNLCFAFQQLAVKGITHMQEPIVVLPNTGEELNIAGSQTFHKIKSKDTNGVFSVMEFVTPPGKGVALHVHEGEDELVYLLDGEIEVTLGDQKMKAVPGVMALLPRGVPHGFTNIGNKPSRLLDTFCSERREIACKAHANNL